MLRSVPSSSSPLLSLRSSSSLADFSSSFHHHQQKIAYFLLVVLFLVIICLTYIIFFLHPKNAAGDINGSQDEVMPIINKNAGNLNNNKQRAIYSMQLEQSRSTLSSSDVLSSLPSSYYVDLAPPMSRQSLGAASWSLLHTMAAFYPCHPSLQQQEFALSFLTSLSHLYPCHLCAQHFRSLLSESPPQVETRAAFSRWMCEAHNTVNIRLNKATVNCSLIASLWPSELRECGCDADKDKNDQQQQQVEQC